MSEKINILEVNDTQLEYLLEGLADYMNNYYISDEDIDNVLKLRQNIENLITWKTNKYERN